MEVNQSQSNIHAEQFYEPDEMCREILSIFCARIYLPVLTTNSEHKKPKNNKTQHSTTGTNATIESERIALALIHPKNIIAQNRRHTEQKRDGAIELTQ